MKPEVSLILLAFMLSGCVATVTREELLARADEVSYTSLPDMFYTGSDERYDYFATGHGGKYRVMHGAIDATPPIRRTSDRGHWRRLRNDGRLEESPYRLREVERRDMNAADALLEAGEIHAGQRVADLLKVCQPYRVDVVEPYTIINFLSIPNIDGLTIFAVDGRLKSACFWGCGQKSYYFNELTEAQETAAWAAHEALAVD